MYVCICVKRTQRKEDPNDLWNTAPELYNQQDNQVDNVNAIMQQFIYTCVSIGK